MKSVIDWSERSGGQDLLGIGTEVDSPEDAGKGEGRYTPAPLVIRRSM